MKVPAIFREPAVANPPRRVWRDWVLVAALVVLLIGEGLCQEYLPGRWLAVGLGLAIAPTLLWRRVLPLPMMALSWGLVIASSIAIKLLTGQPSELWGGAVILVTTYAVFRWGSGSDMMVALGICFVGWFLSVTADPQPLSEAVGGLIFLALPVLLGLVVRYMYQERARRRDQARLDEREALARELHDSVAHHVSAIIIQAQAGQAIADGDPNAASAALERIEATAHEAMREMRSMVGALRSPASLTPQARWDDTHRLADAVPDTIAVSITVPDDDQVPGPVQAAAHRIAQESVTNAIRHGREVTEIDVIINRVGTDDSPDADESIVVRVVNNGRVASPPRDNGFGLIGMTERCEQLGGSLTAGPQPGGGWVVIATLPTLRRDQPRFLTPPVHP